MGRNSLEGGLKYQSNQLLADVSNHLHQSLFSFMGDAPSLASDDTLSARSVVSEPVQAEVADARPSSSHLYGFRLVSPAEAVAVALVVTAVVA